MANSHFTVTAVRTNIFQFNPSTSVRLFRERGRQCLLHWLILLTTGGLTGLRGGGSGRSDPVIISTNCDEGERGGEGYLMWTELAKSSPSVTAEPSTLGGLWGEEVWGGVRRRRWVEPGGGLRRTRGGGKEGERKLLIGCATLSLWLTTLSLLSHSSPIPAVMVMGGRGRPTH